MNFFTFVHFSALFILAFYGIYRLNLIKTWQKERKNQVVPFFDPDFFPKVCVQLPLYNERYVARRLIAACAVMDWPVNRLEVQVLDDSDDETRLIVEQEAALWQAKGIDVKVIRRKKREGYKAGALACGLRETDAELVVIFDADFVPQKDFLRKTIGYFADQSVGIVQARWGFLNRTASWFTRIQAALLDAHFGVEQFLRFRKGLFLNFNGTAGALRRSAIETAGGWQSDTVTEDLDLSFRIHLKGWKAVYVDDLEVPSEIPVTISAMRHQQRRWAKGSMQTARKLIFPIWQSKNTNMLQKFEATMHLCANLGWLMGSLIFLTLYPVLLERVWVGPFQLLRLDIPLFACSTLALLYYYFKSERTGRKRGILESIGIFALLPAFGLGISFAISKGVIEGLFQKGGVFVRTPKYGVKNKALPCEVTYHKPATLSILMDLGLIFYSLMPVHFALERGSWWAVPFLSAFTAGFLMVFYLDLVDFALQAQRFKIRTN